MENLIFSNPQVSAYKTARFKIDENFKCQSIFDKEGKRVAGESDV